MGGCGKVDQYLTGNALQTIQFPIEQTVRRFHTDGYYYVPAFGPQYIREANIT